jgi:hypothetical protein
MAMRCKARETLIPIGHVQVRHNITLYGNNRMIRRGLKFGRFKNTDDSKEAKNKSVNYKNIFEILIETFRRFFNAHLQSSH